MQPPLIAHVVFRFDYGGLENGLVNLVNRMPPERYRHAIVCLEGFSPQFRSRLNRTDAQVLSVGKKPGKDPAAYGRMWHLLRRLGPDVVHTRNLGTIEMQWVAALAGVPRRVHGEHGWSPTDPRGLNRRNLRLRRACRPVIHRFVAMSQDIARWLEAHVGVRGERIRQLYNGVDSDRFRPDGAVPADLPWQGPKLVLGTVGRMDPIKNHDGLLAAFRRILEARPDLRPTLRLIIAGDGPMGDALRHQVASLGLGDCVWLPGARADVAALMRAMDVFVLPSHNEGISNTILEAMASGRPVVAGRVGGNPELVVEGVTGALYDAGRPGALEEALLTYIGDTNLRQSHGAAGRTRVVKEFSLDAMVNNYLALYDDLLSPIRYPLSAIR